MISVLEYNKTKPILLVKILEELNLEFRFTLLESKIIQSDRIIFPPIDNFDKTYRKLQITNIFNLLKLYKKPILSIGNGFLLMANKIIDKEKQGLGFFDFKVSSDYAVKDVNMVECNLCKLKNSELLHNINNDEKIKIAGSQKKLGLKYCTSLVNLEGEKYAITSENKKFYAAHVNYSQNTDFIKKIINNFTCC